MLRRVPHSHTSCLVMATFRSTADDDHYGAFMVLNDAVPTHIHPTRKAISSQRLCLLVLAPGYPPQFFVSALLRPICSSVSANTRRWHTVVGEKNIAALKTWPSQPIRQEPTRSKMHGMRQVFHVLGHSQKVDISTRPTFEQRMKYKSAVV